jgi:hypothetical protein
LTAMECSHLLGRQVNARAVCASICPAATHQHFQASCNVSALIIALISVCSATLSGCFIG